MSEEQIKETMDYRNSNTSVLEEQFIENYYKEFYHRYMQLINNGKYTKEDILQEFHAMVSDREMEELNNFYRSKKEDILQYETSTQEDSNIEDIKQQQEETNLWTNRFKNWYGAIDRIPESARAKFVKMKRDLVKTIKSIFKEKSQSQENTKEQNADGR